MTARILIAGLGNIFHGDDGFGVAVAHALMQRKLPPGVRVVDFGTRGVDLAFALLDPYELVILADAARRGAPPGTLHLIEPELEKREADSTAVLEGHDMVPTRAIETARAMGGIIPRLRLLACEPATWDTGEGEEWRLSPPVEAAVGQAVTLIESLVKSFFRQEHAAGGGPGNASLVLPCMKSA